MLEDVDFIRIKIDNVTNYSFGQDDSGKPAIWAAGKAGWYEITPSDRYLQHYNDTVEAIDLFYFMVDQHQKLSPKRQRLGFHIDPFLVAYQKHTDYRIEDDDDAMETIHKHHKFLLRQMLEEREGIDWSQTHLWKHLADTYADELDDIRAASMILNNPLAAVGPEEESDSSLAASSSEEDDGEEDDGNDEGEDEEEEEAEDESISRDWTQAIWNLLNVLRKSPHFNMRQCGIDELATQVQKLSEFPSDHKAALSAIERSVEPLLRLMNEAKLRKKFNWSTRRIYEELEATLADEIADTVVKTPANKPDKKHRQKSVLRPSGAGKARKRTRALANGDNSQDDDSDAPQLNHHTNTGASTPATNGARARPLPQRNRYARAATEEDEEEDSPSRQLNGHMSLDAASFEPLPDLPPGPEAQEMLELVVKEAKRVGRQHQTGHLEAFLGQWVV